MLSSEKISSDLEFFGYKHWTLEEKPQCFYVGKGLKSRSHEKRKRNHKWHAIAKRFGFTVEICVGPISNKEVCKWEIKNITKEGTYSQQHDHDGDDIGCNFTKGGDTFSSLPEEKMNLIREKISKGVKEACSDPEFRKAMSERTSGSSNPMFGRQSAMKGRKHSEETKAKMSKKYSGIGNPFFGKKHSAVTKQKWKNRIPWNKGKAHTEETKRKLRAAAKRRKSKCSKCGEQGHYRTTCK